MNSTPSFLSVKWAKYICLMAAIYAAAVTAYIFIETAKPTGARDFHPFWYAGHFILQGNDPYEAYLAGQRPELPIRYLDGVTINQYPVSQGDFSAIPSNTPIMLLLLSLFSFFSWGVAKWLFLFFNLILISVTGWLAIRCIPFAKVKLAPLEEVFLFLLYFDFSATRIAAENGQTTLLVFLMMLLAFLYARRSWLVAGSALGLALSKYSLSLPMFVFFLYKKDFRVLFLAAAFQLAGLLGLTALSGNSAVVIMQENLSLFAEIFGQPGIHLSHFFEHFTDNRVLAELPVLVVTLLVFIPLFLWSRRSTFRTASIEEVFDLHLVTILFIWTMLVGYHRLYDTLILIVFMVLVFKGMAYPNIWKLNKKGRNLVMAFMLVMPLILVLPARLVDKVIPHYYGTVSDGVTTVFLLVMLTLSMFLLQHFLQNSQVQTVPRRMESHGIQTDPL